MRRGTQGEANSKGKRPKGEKPTGRQQLETKSKKNEEKEKRKKESGKKKRENTVEIGACINRPYFPSLLANPLFEVPQK